MKTGTSLRCLAQSVILLVFVFAQIPGSAVEQASAASGALIVEGDVWRYFKGTAAPPANWKEISFDDSGWLTGPSGIGYGNNGFEIDDDATELADMYGLYVSVYTRRKFTVAVPASITRLTLNIDYDDGFVAYLNGVEVARRGLGAPGTAVAHTQLAADHDAWVPETIDLSDYLNLLVAGENVLAIQVHNTGKYSSDLSLIPELYWREDALIRSPYLQDMGSNRVKIVWTTSLPGPSAVAYSTDMSFNNQVSAVSMHKVVTASSPFDDYYEHVAELTGLKPATTYHYAIYTQGVQQGAENDLAFKTFAEHGVDSCRFDFAVFGDTGFYGKPSRDIRDRAMERDFDFAVNLGDLAYESGTYYELETNYFQLFQPFLGERIMWPMAGNHEYETNHAAPYLDVFHLPEQAWISGDDERYYSFNYGPAHFVVLDAEDPLQDANNGIPNNMVDWLEADLAADDHFWKIVFVPAPWYVSTDRDHYILVYELLIPLFEQYGVDLVMAGDDHLYERTYPIKNDALSTVADGGVVYVTQGESGGNFSWTYDFLPTQPTWSAVRSDHEPAGYKSSYTHIYIENGVMSLITINDQGSVIDPPGGAQPVVIIDRSSELGSTCYPFVSGRVFEDFDGNGVWDTGDLPLAGVEIELTSGVTTTTSVDGSYQFNNVPAGLYTLTENNPSGYLSSGDVQGNNDDQIGLNVALTADIVNQDFFDYRPASIQGTVYEDADNNAQLSPGDRPLANVEMVLSNGMTTTTNLSGQFTFGGLLAGNYSVTEIDPAHATSILDSWGGNDNQIDVTLNYAAQMTGLYFLDRSPRLYLPLVIKP